MSAKIHCICGWSGYQFKAISKNREKREEGIEVLYTDYYCPGCKHKFTIAELK